MKFYPTRNDLTSPDKVERIVKDVYDKLYRKELPQTPEHKVKRINVNTGQDVGGK